MTRISKLTLVAAVAAMGIAAPAFAQSFDPDVGTGNIVPFSVGPAAAPATAHQKRVATHKASRNTVATRQSGLNAFAAVPGSTGGSAFSPAANGGGSAGYNENLLRDQW